MELVGRGAYLGELRSRVSTFLGLLAGEDLSNLATGHIDLGGTGDLTRGYETGNIASIRYEAGNLPEQSRLGEELEHFLDLYEVLVQSRDALVEDADPAAVESAIAAGLEARKERWHRRSERNPRLARDAKRYHGSTCMVCGFNFVDRYGELGMASSKRIT